MWIEAYWLTQERVVDVTGDCLSPNVQRPDAYQLPAIKARVMVS